MTMTMTPMTMTMTSMTMTCEMLSPQRLPPPPGSDGCGQADHATFTPAVAAVRGMTLLA